MGLISCAGPRKFKNNIGGFGAVLSLSGIGFAETAKKRVLFVTLAQPELAVNVVKECPAVDVTYLQDKADFVIGWGMNEKENKTTGSCMRQMDTLLVQERRFVYRPRRGTSAKRFLPNSDA